MLGLFYLVLAIYVGHALIKRFLPQLAAVSEGGGLSDGKVRLPGWMLTWPASFLVGTLSVTWTAYLLAYAFVWTKKPLFYADLLLLGAFALFAAYRLTRRPERLTKALAQLRIANFRDFCLAHRVELTFILLATLVWGVFIYRSFNISGTSARVGLSVYSDFGPHLAMIRSFSQGLNIPTQYPHFPDGTVRYHFMFQFLAGNLEFLGLRLDHAFNIPSILSFTAFIMLLYAFATLVFRRRLAGIITAILFLFRSSFAIFTFLASNTAPVLARILRNADHIGRTQCENWGLWAQKSYINQRHFPFALGIMLLILIVVLPTIKKMAAALANARKEPRPVQAWCRELFQSEDAWWPQDPKRALFLGVILGLMGFWNGAVVIGTLLILAFLAFAAKHRLEFINIAVITGFMVLAESLFFVGPGKSVVQPRIVLGFLASQRDLMGIIKYYLEVLGVFPLAVLASLFILPRGGRWMALAFAAPLVLATTVQLTPDLAVSHKYVMMTVNLLNVFVAGLAIRLLEAGSGSGAAAIGCGAPAALEAAASTDKPADAEAAAATEAETAVPPEAEPGRISSILRRMEKTARALGAGLAPVFRPILPFAGRTMAVVLLLLMTVTGVVDMITLYNMDRATIPFDTRDPLTLWVRDNTPPDAIFLTDIYVTHPILLAGRKIFYGWPYFAWSAGYETSAREATVRELFRGGDAARVRSLAAQNKIGYLVVENGNRTGQYMVNQQFFDQNFPLVYRDAGRDLSIYKL